MKPCGTLTLPEMAKLFSEITSKAIEPKVIYRTTKIVNLSKMIKKAKYKEKKA